MLFFVNLGISCPGDKFFDLIRIFAGGIVIFHARGDVNAIGAYCLNCLGYIARMESPCKEEQFFVSGDLSQEIPVEGGTAARLRRIKYVSRNLGLAAIPGIFLHVFYIKGTQHGEGDGRKQILR